MTVEEVGPEDKESKEVGTTTVNNVVEKPGFMENLGTFIRSATDEIAVLFALVSYAAMIMMGKTIPIEYTGMAIMLVTDYVKKEWKT